MHRYPTRFQSRNSAKEQAPAQPVKEQAPVQAVKEQAPAQPVKEQAPAQVVPSDSYLKDISILTELLNRCATGVERIKKAIDVFAYLSAHNTLLRSPVFRAAVSNKIVQLRQEMENKKKEAIDVFVSVYSPDGNNDNAKQTRLNAHGVLYYTPLLEVELKKVESMIH